MREYSVSEINSHIKSVISDDFVLRNICIKGEISNCKYHTNGHIYFTLKDDRSSIRAVIWKTVPRPDFKLEDGLEIVVQGQVGVYEAGGYYQINVRELKRSGLGDLYLKLDYLKKQYSQMGYFAPQYKKKISPFSSRIGIVTSKTGAAVQDICRIARDINPFVELYLYNALVQGNGAAQSIVRGIEALDRMDLDVIIIGRGGGSIEDLWAFNEEIVAESVFACNTPIVSAVGHETDDTITDLIADRRAATPSDAARIAVCDISHVFDQLKRYKESLMMFTDKKVRDYRLRLEEYSLMISKESPMHRLDVNKQHLSKYRLKLDSIIKYKTDQIRYDLQKYNTLLLNNIKILLEKERFRLKNLTGRLELLSPLKSLSRGFGYIESENGMHISVLDDMTEEEYIKIFFTDGFAKALVKEKVHDTNGLFRTKLQET